MSTLTVNIEDQSAEESVKAFLDKLGLAYSIESQSSSKVWWEDETLVNEINKRSEELKSGIDKGSSFEDIKKELLNR